MRLNPTVGSVTGPCNSGKARVGSAYGLAASLGRQGMRATVMTTAGRRAVAATVTKLSLMLAVFILTASLAAEAQPTGKIYRIGYLAAGWGSGTAYLRPLEAFRQGLRELGWVEGQNVLIEYRFAEGRLERLPGLAEELVRLKVDVIAASPTPAALAAKNVTRTIPIVGMSLTEPVGVGLVTSLARPGGNVTGVAYGFDTDIFGKQLELLKEVIPRSGGWPSSRTRAIIPLNR
jgi:ABC-type uncharacterized transport system substrate-binding protein